jgi:hypothetical protein
MGHAACNLATGGMLSVCCPCGPASGGYLCCPTRAGGNTAASTGKGDKFRDRSLLDLLLREDEEILAIIMAAFNVLRGIRK